MIKNLTLLLIGLMFMPLLTKAHGEDKLGPNGGYIKMPSGFHTEVVTAKEMMFKVYLLDMDFKNPVTQNSRIEAYIEDDGKKSNAICVPAGNYFLCKTRVSLKSGKLYIQATRNNMKSEKAAEYVLPLKL